MSHLYLLPRWFLSYSIYLEIFFAIITFIVAFYAYKLYKLSSQRELKLLGWSFSLISLSYILWALLNIFVITKMTESCVLHLEEISMIALTGVYLHILLFMFGLIVLTYMSLKIEDWRILAILFIIILLSVFFMQQKAIVIYLISAVLLLFILISYLSEYVKKKNNKCFLILIAFALLFIGRFDFLFTSRNQISYVLGHFFEFISYLLILICLIKSLKHGKEKKPSRNH